MKKEMKKKGRKQKEGKSSVLSMLFMFLNIHSHIDSGSYIAVHMCSKKSIAPRFFICLNYVSKSYYYHRCQ